MPLFQDNCKNLIPSTILLTFAYFFNIYYNSGGDSTVFNMAVSISGIENLTEVCRTFGSVFEVGKSDTLQLGTVNVTDVKPESLGTSIIFCYCKITKKCLQPIKCVCVRVLGCMCNCVCVFFCYNKPVVSFSTSNQEQSPGENYANSQEYTYGNVLY